MRVRALTFNSLYTVKLGKKLWMLTHDMKWYVTLGDTQYVIVVPKGFYTDGASCPNALASICTPMSGFHAEAAVLHDYLYSKDCKLQFTRSEVDDIFLQAMKEMGTALWRRLAIYSGVRSGGWASFKKAYSVDKLDGKYKDDF